MATDRPTTRLVAGLALVMALAVAACSSGAAASPAASDDRGASAPATGDATATPDGSPATSPQPSPERSVPRVSPPAASVDLAGIPQTTARAVLADAAGRTGVDPAAITFVRAEPTTWPDGSLGCPEPGQMYTQALVPGYWIVVDAGGQRLDYRASERGGLKLCENPPGPG